MINRMLMVALSFLLLSTAVAPLARAEGNEPSVGNAFIEAFDKKDEAGMMNIIKTRSKEVPDEVQAMVEYAASPKAAKQEQDFLFNIAGSMAMMYSKVTGDDRLLGAVKQNYQAIMEKRGGSGAELSQKGVEKAKHELVELGKGEWKITSFAPDSTGELIVEIDVKEPTGGSESSTPKIEFAKANQARDIVTKNLPGAKKGKILWSSAGIGLKTVLFETDNPEKKASKAEKKNSAGHDKSKKAVKE
jgi:hypothetical protein